MYGSIHSHGQLIPDDISGSVALVSSAPQSGLLQQLTRPLQAFKMSNNVSILTLITLLLVSITIADLTEQNATICNWAQARAGVIRDTVYLDGGEMWWKVGFADGSTNMVTNNGNDQGLLYYLNFSEPFDTTKTNLTALFQSKAKAGGAANNSAPNYVDGTMFANNDELLLYGGLLRLTNAYSPPADNAVLGYEAYQYGPYRSSWNPGFVESSTSSGVTRYVTNGAGANVPSENLGFYFGGMRSANGGPIYRDDESANMSSNTLIEVEMSSMRDEKWTNHTLPDNIKPRANAQLVWVPVSKQGVLVAIGGVNPPEEIFAAGLNSSEITESKADSPGFMTSLPVYDIATASWYTQETTGDPPPQLTEFCSVVAAAEDDSSHNIYIYGGYDGLNAADLPSDDVWILSLPAFRWVRAYAGSTSHGRSGHTCVKPYPDQMFVIGGLHQDPTQCVEGGIIQVFNLNTLNFQSSYTPSTWSEYKVPQALYSVIGGTERGGATTQASWSDGELGSIFATSYPKQVKHYYPYHTDSSIADTTSGKSYRGSSGFPRWAIAVLAVLLSLILLSVCILAWLLMRRRRLLREHLSEGTYASDDSHRIIRWVHGMPTQPNRKEPSSVYSTSNENQSVEATVVPTTNSTTHEAGGSERFELHSENMPEKKPVEMATPYNDRENWTGSSEIGLARGSSLYDDRMTYQGNEKVSPLQSTGGSSFKSKSASDYSSHSDETRRISPYNPPAIPQVGYPRESADDWHQHIVSPVSEEGTYRFIPGR